MLRTFRAAAAAAVLVAILAGCSAGTDELRVTIDGVTITAEQGTRADTQ